MLYAQSFLDRELADRDFVAVIGSLSLRATRTFRIKHNKTKKTMDFSVGHGTLVIIAGTMQQFWKHEILKTKQNVG